MTPVPDLFSLSSSELRELVGVLLVRLDALEADVADLKAENAVLRIENTKLKVENAELRAKLGKPPKTPDNSSMPPSSGDKAKGSGVKTRKKRNGRKGTARDLCETPDRVVDVYATTCPHCNGPAKEEDQRLVGRWDKVDIPPVRPETTRVNLYRGRCACCGCAFTGTPPKGLENGSPFGPNIRAMAIYLRQKHMIGYERLRQLFADLFGLSISEGALNNIFARAGPKFAGKAADVLAEIRAARVVMSDETGARLNGDKGYLWFFGTDTAAYYRIARSRAGQVARDVMEGHKPDVWVSDRYSAQKGHGREQQACLAHLLRDAKYAGQCGDDALAAALARIFKTAVSRSNKGANLKESTRRHYVARLDRELDKALTMPVKSEEGRVLVKELKANRDKLFVCVRDPDVPATNNGSERGLRPSVTFRKVTGCFRTDWGADLHANARSLIETARKTGQNPYTAITAALAAS